MKRISMILTAAAVMAVTTFSSTSAQAGGVKVSLGHNNQKTVHGQKQAVVQQQRHAANYSVCRGYYTNQSYQYWVNGYWQQNWVDTSYWTVNGLTTGGQANYVWITDGYNDSYWVNGYWATGYNQVWIGDGCYRCRSRH